MNLSSRSKWLIWQIAGCIVLVAAAVLVYWPVFSAQFLWDDEFLVLRNSFIRSPVLGLEVFGHFLFTETKGEFYRPIQNWSYMFDYWRAGLNPFAFHLTNLAIHSFNSVVIFLLLRKLIGKLGNVESFQAMFLAFCIALFWVLHPVHSAVVAYVSGRADSLALAGLLSGWMLWEWGIDNSRRTRAIQFLAAALFVLAGCCSKEIALAGLGFFVVHLWAIRIDLPVAGKIKTSLALLGVFSIYLTLRHLPEPNVAPPAAAPLAWLEKGNLFIRAMGDYARLLVWPEKLFMERQVSFPTGLFTDPVKNDPLFPWLGWLGGVFLAVLAISLFWKGNARRLRALGALWFGALILPVSNLFSLNATIAEHWLYIPSIGIGLWLAGCWIDSRKLMQRTALIVAPFCLLLLGWRASQRAADWKDPLTFYRATVLAGGDSVRIRMNLAVEYQRLGNLNEADRIFRSVLAVLPDFYLAKVALAQNLEKQGRSTQAGALLTSSQSSAPRSATEQIAAIGLLASTHDLSLVTTTTRSAYEAHPDSWPLAKALAEIYRKKGQPRVSLELVKRFALRNWWHAESQNELGEFYLAEGFPNDAVTTYLAAARLDIRDAEPLNQAALILAQNGKFDESIAVQKSAIERNGGDRQKEILALIQKLAAGKASSK